MQNASVTLKMSRAWAMPSKDTFSIQPIRDLIGRYLDDGLWVDPFAGCSPFKSQCLTNDLNPSIEADYNLDARDFLSGFTFQSVDGVLFDPPYSPRQVAEVYKHVGYEVTMETTQATFWTKIKREIGHIMIPGA